MAANFRLEGKVVPLTVAAAAGVKSGGGILIGSVFGIAQGDAAQHEVVQAALTGTYDMPKVAPEAWVQGAPIYWVAASSLVSNVAGSNQMIGTAMDIVEGPATTGHVRLIGPPGIIPAVVAAGAITDLTEDGGAIGGSSNGDLPSLTATAATLTGSLTGVTNGALVDIAATAGSCAGTDSPSATNVDSAIATAVASIVTGVNVQNKELLEMINKLVADNVALRAAVRENATAINVANARLRSAGIVGT